MYKTLPLYPDSFDLSRGGVDESSDAPVLDLGADATDDNIDWKSMYLRAHTIEHHWRCGEVRPTKVTTLAKCWGGWVVEWM